MHVVGVCLDDNIGAIADGLIWTDTDCLRNRLRTSDVRSSSARRLLPTSAENLALVLRKQASPSLELEPAKSGVRFTEAARG